MPVAQRSRRIREGASGGPRAASSSLLAHKIKKLSFCSALVPAQSRIDIKLMHTILYFILYLLHIFILNNNV